MRSVQKVIGVGGVLLYGLFSPLLGHAQEANDPDTLPAAIEQNESEAAASVQRDVGGLDEDAGKAFKNEAEKDVAQLDALWGAPAAGKTPSPKVDDSLSAIEADERSLEAQARALDQGK